MNTALIIVLASFCGAMIGLALTKRNKERELYYKDVEGFCAYLINNISYRSEKLSPLVASANTASESFKRNLKEYGDFISGGELKLSANCLNKSEKAAMTEFFSELGRYDGETQLCELKRREDIFRQKKAEIKEKNDKQGSAYIKLGLLFGLLVGILLI